MSGFLVPTLVLGFLDSQAVCCMYGHYGQYPRFWRTLKSFLEGWRHGVERLVKEVDHWDALERGLWSTLHRCEITAGASAVGSYWMNGVKVWCT